MAVQRTLICLATTALLMQLAMAANYTVGGPNGGWDAATNLQSWATSQSFSVGDILIFQYTSSHSVLEVTKANYDSCQTGNPTQSHTDGNTVITLSSPGKRYFICGAPGHCAGGMKVEIDTLATSSPPASSPTSPPPRASRRSTPTPAASPSTPPSNSPVSSPEISSPSPAQSPKTASTVTPPSNSPVSSPKISSPSPAQSPKTASTVSPTSPSSSPSGSPPTLNVPSTVSPTTAPPPGSSSATKSTSKTTITMGFSLGMLMLLSL